MDLIEHGMQNRAMDTLTLQTIAMLCLTRFEAQIFLKLFTTSNMLRTKKEVLDHSQQGMDNTKSPSKCSGSCVGWHSVFWVGAFEDKKII